MTKQSYHLPYLPQFKFGIIWTFIDSFGSQGLVILFHLLYRTYAGTILHGVLGCLLSLIYLAVAIANLGLDTTLAPFLETFSVSRTRFWLLTQVLLIPQVVFLAILCSATYLSSSHIPGLHFFKDIAPYFSTNLLIYTLLIFFFESNRKTIRAFLQLSFYFRLAAFVELLGIGINVAGIIALHYFGHLTLLTSLQILMYASLLQCILLIAGLAYWYQTLDTLEIAPISKLELFFRISKTRIFSWVLNCLHQLYSGNFLVPLCAFQFGIESASLMKVISSISYWVTIVAKKVLGVTSNALLAHLKSRSQETQTQAFHFLTEVFNQVLYGLLIFLIINGKKIALHHTVPSASAVTWSLLYGMVLLTFLESLFVLYEKWYIVEEDAHTYLGINLLSIGVVYVVVQYLQTPLAILSTIVCIRLSTFMLLSLYSFYRWNIWPSFRPYGKTLICALVISGIGYALL